MATLSFEVHTDKENLSAATVPRKSAKGFSARPLGSQDQNQLPAPTGGIGKPLQNVNQGLGMARHSAKDPVRGQPGSALAMRNSNVENVPPMTGFAKKLDRKHSPMFKKEVHSSACPKKSSKSKFAKAKVKKEVEPIPHVDIPDNDDEYDSDSIFPRAERLSSYVDKLMSWRPPCLFGSLPHSDSEASDREEDFIWDDLGEAPVCLPEFPDFPSPEDLTEEDLVDAPIRVEDSVTMAEPQEAPRNEFPDPLTDQSFNTSLHLGPLEMVVADTSDSFASSSDSQF